MYTNIYFDNNRKTIIATAVNPNDSSDVYRFESDRAHIAIHGLCNLISEKHGNKIAGEVLLYLRDLYYKIVSIVVREDNTGNPSIWSQDCNRYNSLLNVIN